MSARISLVSNAVCGLAIQEEITKLESAGVPKRALAGYYADLEELNRDWSKSRKERIRAQKRKARARALRRENDK
jgi:hypothetical protein